ncbi:SDR family NAD(P)-dependent oxidoreductase [Rhodovulum sp. 12E13]|uniref:SDR family NAD(P)-dependent oxidoreductase n=1 Tax=Rhodovulum sp. 12E13 TaxID=2203891 RepID=UPI000E1A874A|nr:SDR family NAD(P)-dependent oxidoreductase [Rhodovulum sp. 12E13]RDC74907.1 SDR family NAD(P)-dependent oxidoreductase [Rhodovulum sp. 12E13]
MREWAGKRYWVVGASEGLGRALATKMSRAGAHLVVSARDEGRLAELAEELPGQTTIAPCDVSDDESVKEAAGLAGDVDGVVYLASVYWPQSAREWNAGQVTAMCDINFTGCARVLGQAVPGMVARDSGHVVITGSLTAFRGLPGSIGYTASKAALLSLAECMHYDLRKTGVDVQVIHPGFIRTRQTEKNDFSMPFIMDPEPAAEIMFDFMQTDRFKKSFPALFSYVFRGSQFLPDWAYYRMFGG